MASLSNHTFIIFGANGGIGSALAKRLNERGASLVLSGRNKEALDGVADECTSARVATVTDAADAASIQVAVDVAREMNAPLAGVANCFGTMLLKPAHLTSEDDWAETVRVNLTSAFLITKAVARAFPKEGGSVVFFSTVAARVGLPNHEAIAAAKAGLTGLALSAASTYAAKQIRFNVVAPGLTDTPLAAKITGNEAALKASIQMHPLGRIGAADEVASAAEWFLDPAQSWVTGQVVGVDGGLGSVRGRMAG